MSADETLDRIWVVIEDIHDEDNQFGSAAAAWKAWQDRAEELADLLSGLDADLCRGGPLPARWHPDPLAGATYCPDCGTWLDYPNHREDCPYREKTEEQEERR